MVRFQDVASNGRYRASLTSDEDDPLKDFACWLDLHGIAYQHNVVAADGEYSVWTGIVTDRTKAIMLRLAWG